MCTKAHAHPSHTHPTLNYQLLKFVDMPAKSVWSSWRTRQNQYLGLPPDLPRPASGTCKHGTVSNVQILTYGLNVHTPTQHTQSPVLLLWLCHFRDVETEFKRCFVLNSCKENTHWKEAEVVSRSQSPFPWHTPLRKLSRWKNKESKQAEVFKKGLQEWWGQTS